MTDRFNAQTYLVTRNVEAGLGDKVAVRAAEATTYAELDDLCGVVAASLREGTPDPNAETWEALSTRSLLEGVTSS